MASEKIKKQIQFANRKAGKTYTFNSNHDPNQLAQWWFQRSTEGLVLFLVFYTQACRWSRCLGCNLPSRVSQEHVPFDALINQVDNLFSDPQILARCNDIQKVIVSNNGSVLDEDTFSSTALMYLIAKLNIHLPNMRVLSMETRPEYVDMAELEFISRALAEGHTPTALELAVGFEAYDNHIRNDIFDKGLTLEVFESMVEKMARYGFHLKCYFMQKPVPEMSDIRAVEDIRQGIDFLNRIAAKYEIRINMHLNPTYVAYGTALETAFSMGMYTPPRLKDVARAALSAKDKSVSVFVGLSDEGLAVPGGSFLKTASEPLLTALEQFNQTQDFSLLEKIIS